MLALAVALALATVQKPAELFVNGGFESGFEGWRPLNLSGGTTFELDTTVKASGRQSLRLARTGVGRPDFLKISTPLRGKQGQLAVSIAYRVEKDSALHVTAYFFDAGDATIGKGFVDLVNARATKGFATEKVELVIPKDAVGFGLNVQMEKAGTAWVDDASAVLVVPGGKGKAAKSAGFALANGSFDEGLEGWYAAGKGSETAKAERDAAVKSGGAAALCLARESARLAPEDVWQCDVEELAGAKSARLRLKARVQGSARSAAVLQAFDARGVCLATGRRDLARATDRFEAAELALQLPKGTARLVVALAVAGSGRAWFDDLVLEGK